ncbi:MAG: hypothetical protein ABL880_07255 [Methylotenera sp.]
MRSNKFSSASILASHGIDKTLLDSSQSMNQALRQFDSLADRFSSASILASHGIDKTLLDSSQSMNQALRQFDSLTDKFSSASILASHGLDKAMLENSRSTSDVFKQFGRLTDKFSSASSLVSLGFNKTLVENSQSMNQALRQFDSLTDKFSSASILASHSINKALIDASKLLTKSEYIDAILFELESDSSLKDETEFSNLEIEKNIEELSKAKTHSGFLARFVKLPAWLQLLLIFIAHDILLAQVNNITANLMTPYIQEIIDFDGTDKEKINVIKKIQHDEINFENMRFISASNVFLRITPNSKSNILDRLQVGLVVTLVSKTKSWSEVTYLNADGEMMHGWVFSIYVSKFKKS